MSDIDKKQDSLKERRKSARISGANEKRNFIRTDVSVPVDIYIQKDKEIEKIPAKAWNISASGIMLESGVDLKVGMQAKINMIPPGTLNPVHCSGKIVWSTTSSKKGRHNLGVEFLAIEEDNKNTFLKFLCDLIYKSAESK
jgi:c-di-GMP-binding flagellar brake protein YcgR